MSNRQLRTVTIAAKLAHDARGVRAKASKAGSSALRMAAHRARARQGVVELRFAVAERVLIQARQLLPWSAPRIAHRASRSHRVTILPVQRQQPADRRAVVDARRIPHAGAAQEPRVRICVSSGQPRGRRERARRCRWQRRLKPAGTYTCNAIVTGQD